jgi:hypothetical protein
LVLFQLVITLQIVGWLDLADWQKGQATITKYTNLYNYDALLELMPKIPFLFKFANIPILGSSDSVGYALDCYIFYREGLEMKGFNCNLLSKNFEIFNFFGYTYCQFFRFIGFPLNCTTLYYFFGFLFVRGIYFLRRSA